MNINVSKDLKKRILSRKMVSPWNKAISKALFGIAILIGLWSLMTIQISSKIHTNYLGIHIFVSKLIFFILLILYAWYVSYILGRREIFFTLAALFAFVEYVDGVNNYFSPIQNFIYFVFTFFNAQDVYETIETWIGNACSEGIIVWLAIDAVGQHISNQRDTQWQHKLLIIYNTIINQIQFLNSTNQIENIEIIKNYIQSYELEKYCIQKLKRRLKPEDRIYYKKLLAMLKKLNYENMKIDAKHYLLILYEIKELLECSEIII